MDEHRMQAMLGWWDTSLGQRVLGQELLHIDNLVSRFVGPYALYMGVGSMSQCLRASRAEVLMECLPPLKPHHRYSAQADFSALPIRPQSLDGVVLHHLLDVVPNPHDVIRETCMAIIPGGRLLIVGFNPYSLWGVWRGVRRYREGRAPWLCQFLSPLRAMDWLKVMGFQVDRVEHAVFDWPSQDVQWRQRFGWMGRIGQRFLTPFGAVYCMSAVKREYGAISGRKSSRRPAVVMPMRARALREGAVRRNEDV